MTVEKLIAVFDLPEVAQPPLQEPAKEATTFKEESLHKLKVWASLTLQKEKKEKKGKEKNEFNLTLLSLKKSSPWRCGRSMFSPTTKR